MNLSTNQKLKYLIHVMLRIAVFLNTVYSCDRNSNRKRPLLVGFNSRAVFSSAMFGSVEPIQPRPNISQ